MNKKNNKKGFTLIELLVVMGILGILMAVTILVINPAEYLKRARDTQRISDIGTINSAVGLALANGATLTNSPAGCYATIAGTPIITAACNGGVAGTAPLSGDRTSAGAGWVHGINISTSMGTLPIDPSNSTTFFYMWANDGSDYELDANVLESVYYGSSSTGQKTASTDGGNSATRYEVGIDLTLIP